MSPQSNASDNSASYTLQNLNLSNSGGSMHYPGAMSGYQQQQPHPAHHQVQQQQQQQQHFYAPQILCLDQNNMQQQYGGAFTASANDAFGSPKPDYGKPHLVILEQPVDKFRFRYQSEMHGTHGSLMGQRTEKSKKTFPTVELRGYSGEAKVRCSLYQVEESRRAPHSHLLVIKSGEEDLIDPHDVDVGPNAPGDTGGGGGGGGGYVATFQGMGIIHTAKKFIGPELYKKLRKHRLTRDNREPTEREEKQMQDEAAQMARTMNLNQVCLCFQAFEVDPATSQWKPLTEPVYSNAINNMKSALTGELKICRLSTTFSSVDGGEEVFMFVEKVCKNNIQIRFFELDEYETEVWVDKAVFSEADVHHQYAIAFKTPPYRNKDITEPVEVYMQLYRPKDHCLSEPVPFKYKPRAGMMPVPGGSGTNSSRKRLRMSSGTVSSEIPTVLPNDPNAPTVANASSEGAGGNANAQSQLPSMHRCLHAAIRRNDTTIAQMLIALLDEYGLTEELLDLPNDRNETALHLAVTANNGPLVEALLAAGAALNYCDYRGNTALHRAVVENVPDMVRLLLKHMQAKGARMDSTNDDGLTPLQAAVYAKNLKITRILIDAGAPVGERDLKHGNNILHIAVDNDSLDIVHYLLEKVGHATLGQERNNAGYTPLQLANARCHTSNGSNKLIVRELLRHDPDGLRNDERQPTMPRMKNPHDQEEDDEEEDDEEEDEGGDKEEEEDDAGQSRREEKDPSAEHRTTVLDSIDLNCDRADIARLLEEHKPETAAKESVVAPKEPRSESTMFDEQCMGELCRFLNVDGAWKELGSLLDFHAFFAVWEQSSNPARMLLDYYEMQTLPLDRLIGMLRALELRDSMQCIDEMICRKMK
ncbi:AGAP006747-PA-like protein [Anopheles sinensis]|uniref:AGAP006747-PA-like protein n=1 Tax=Anopheles sinensis TaxID=74873 RepID=A0A084WLE0_ANOSI|nr:AGAP006747-PA-like protein [Anopheles sinensis]